tara:strand:- start:3582 stop:3815 length:234 start_codon:yes stop_codon:yes gene_type:complete
MQIKMLISTVASGNKEGTVDLNYRKDEIFDMSQDWQIKIAQAFIDSNIAMEVKHEPTWEAEPVQKETKKKSKKKNEK